MTLIQAYQINLPSLASFISGVATGTGISSQYYPATGNPSGFLPSGNLIAGTGVTITQSGQDLIVNSISSSPATYFGFTGFTVSGAGTHTGNLVLNQGVLTTRVNLLNGIYTANFIIGSGNVFPGAIARYNMQIASGTGINVNISGLGGVNINQAGTTQAITMYSEWSYNGNNWCLDIWS